MIKWNLIKKIEEQPIIQTVRNGLIMAIPVLMIGSVSVVLNSLPIPSYQNFIKSFMDGALADVFTMIHNATFGLLSIYMALTISLCYAKSHSDQVRFIYGAPVTTLICFSILSGVFSEEFSTTAFGAQGMAVAIISAICASSLYTYLAGKMQHSFKLYADGADGEFNNSISVIAPAAIVVVLFAIINHIIVYNMGVSGINEFFINAVKYIFNNMGRTLTSGFLFVLISSFLWFFGIHGDNVLVIIEKSLFAPGTAVNELAIMGGQPPTEIFTQTFFNVFVLMGGCGTTFCLLAAILLFSKRHSNRSLAKIAIFPMVFNINEIMVFGLPIVLNPIFFIPFMLVPIFCFFTTYLAMAAGLVPLTVTTVKWITPIFFSGYLSTGSFSAVILQLFNLVIGTLIYKPFIKLYDDEKMKKSEQELAQLITCLKESEKNLIPVCLTDLSDSRGVIAKTIVSDLRQVIMNQKFDIYYQPQHDKDKCIGVEALLRWNHPQFGMLYPPLVIKLAEEMGLLELLEQNILIYVTKDVKTIKSILGEDTKISVNVSGMTVQSLSFELFLKGLMEGGLIRRGDIWLEITEQMALKSDADTKGIISRIREMGYPLAIDDFSMGHTSLKYLQNNQFDLVKLDGALVRGLRDNPRCKDIISSIVFLASTMGFSVLAEYVETKEQREELEKIGCLQWQGYLYSPAVPLEKLCTAAKSEE